jgi:Mg2+-importing ATPase
MSTMIGRQAINLPKGVSGLSMAEAKRRLGQYGTNEIIQSKKRSIAAVFFLRFKNPLIIILILAAAISAFFGNRIDPAIIVVMVLLSVTIDFINTYKSQKAAEALRERVKITATAVRDGKIEEVPLALIVPGDIVALSPGDVIPADGELITAKDFFVNESSLTGESFPMEKEMKAPVFMGSSVVTGTALMSVLVTGRKTKFSGIAEMLLKKEEPTDFDRGIKDFSVLIMKVIMVLVVFVFFVNALTKHELLESFLFAIALAVGLTPELLPMVIAINLSRGSLVMSKHGVIVKKLSAIQNFGSMDILCTDKTGTLTEDRIVLIKCVDGFGAVSNDVFLYSYINSYHQSGFLNPLDSAVVTFRDLDIEVYQKVDETPFDYIRKRNTVVVDGPHGRILITKGAPEELLRACRFYRDGKKPLAGDTLARIHETYERLSREGFRVLGVAIKEIHEVKSVYGKNEERDMTFSGFIAFLDPAKKTVAETLKTLEEYGIEIKIITGDNDLVSKKIAADINLPLKGVLTDTEISGLSDDALRLKVEQTTIFARVSPDEKTRIIRLLQKNGHVVGYMGDGINDAPSLKAADVGISVNNAVDVAKESADFILIHKSLKDLVNGVIEGRKTFANTMKYLMMSLSSNFGNMFSMAGASLFIPFLPMLPTQILLNNLIYDTSQLTIPMDNVDREDIKNPRKLNIGFIKKFMLIFGPISSIFDIVTFFTLLFVFHLNESSFQTGWFLESLATQALVIYIIRSRFSFFRSRPSLALVISTIAGVVVGWAIALSPFGGLFNFSVLPFSVLFAIGLIVAAYLFTIEVVKRMVYRKLIAV